VSEPQVVFFGAGGYARELFGELNKEYAPVAYGDNDPKKQGTSFMGLPVLSLEQTETRHPGCRYYITVDFGAKPYVTESLIAGGVDRYRIINFEEYKRYRSCWQLETCMYYYLMQTQRNLAFCCSDFWKNISPRIPVVDKLHAATMSNFFSTRNKIVDELNTSAEVSKENTCNGCRNIKNALWQTNRRIHLLNFRHRSLCNFMCSYCKSRYETIDEYFDADIDEALSFLRFIKANNIIDASTTIHLAAGEISVHPRRNEILTELQNFPCWVFTNASIYSEKIGEMLSAGRSRVYVSIDAGTRNTFAAIKGLDVFDEVCENLLRYSKDGFVHLKYIVIPGVNDNKTDIDEFIALCQRIKIRAVDVVRDYYDPAAFSDHTINKIASMLYELRKIGVAASASDNAFSATPFDQSRIAERLADLTAGPIETASAVMREVT